MTKDTTLKSFTDLPDDVLLEILSYLSASSIILFCRQVCRKMNRLSREKHLWIRLYNQTKHMLRPAIDLNQERGSELEKIIARAEVLERRWSDEGALWAAPRYWRGAVRTRGSSHGFPSAIMGDYVVFRSSASHGPQTSYTWVDIHDMDSPAVFSHVIPLLYETTCYMDPAGQTFFVVSALFGESSLKVVGIQTDIGGPYVAVEYSVPLRHRTQVNLLHIDNGLVCINHRPHPDSPHLVDVLDLQTRTLSHFNPIRLRSILPPGEPSVMRTLYNAATKAYLVQTYSESFFAIFGRSDQGAQPTDSTPLTEPILKGRFPASFSCALHIIPRTVSSFVVVGIEQVGRYWLHEPCLLRIHLLSISLSDPQASVKELCSLDVPGTFGSFALYNPPPLAQYALGALSVMQRALDGSDADEECRYYSARVDIPDTPRGEPAGKSQNYITLNRMYLSPAIDERSEEARFCYFDPFSGKALLSVKSGLLESVLVLDYLHGDEVETQT